MKDRLIFVIVCIIIAIFIASISSCTDSIGGDGSSSCKNCGRSPVYALGLCKSCYKSFSDYTYSVLNIKETLVQYAFNGNN